METQAEAQVDQRRGAASPKPNGIGRPRSRLFPSSGSDSGSGSSWLEEFASICSDQVKPGAYPLASRIEKNVPIYELPPFASLDESERADLQDEWYRVLESGPGVFVLGQMYGDHELLDRVNGVYEGIIAEEKRAGTARGDHFAGAGKNDRIWNSFGKHCLADAASFQSYYANPYLSLVASSWLGPGYRVTAQVNNVKPGAGAQVSHRDYHLGFQAGEEACAKIPRGMQVASQFLTLQGAVAHVDVPPESGPTRLLPFSQRFEPGYLAYRRPEFDAYFLDNYVSLPLRKGDGLFFNPALFHAAGENRSAGVERMANLLQISSPFGKPMEAVQSLQLVERCWDGLTAQYAREGMSDEVAAFLAALTEGYPFPTNLDRNPPANAGMAPDSEQDVVRRCLEAGKSRDEVAEELRRLAERSMP